MAENELDLDVEEGAGDKKKSGGMKIVIFAVAMVVLVSGAVMATLFFTGVLGGNDTVAVHDETEAEEETVAEDLDSPQIYHPIEPPFVVNFNDDSEVRFLQVTLQIATRDPEVIDQVKEHSPAIRNSLVMLFSSQDPQVLNTREGKESLRNETLEEVRKVLEEQTGDGGVDNVYFTSFVMQ